MNACEVIRVPLVLMHCNNIRRENQGGRRRSGCHAEAPDHVFPGYFFPRFEIMCKRESKILLIENVNVIRYICSPQTLAVKPTSMIV